MTPLLVEQRLAGGGRNFGYLTADPEQRAAALIDPSFAPEILVQSAAAKGLVIEYIFITHDHPDHTAGVERAEKLTGRRRLRWRDKDPVTGRKAAHAVRFPLGSFEIEVLHTPGHTPDSICLRIGDAVFTGDTLFVGKVGGTDLGSGAKSLYKSLHETLLALPDETRVFPGHDYGTSPESTIGVERRTNPFFQCPDLAAFIDLKRNWSDYKKAHGIS